jgi:bifunctional DNase/RNase
MEKVELEIIALHHSVGQNPNYAMVLGEVIGNRRLPIVIGAFEAQAIVVAMESMSPNRPLTHDLFKNTLDTFDIQLQEVIINNLLDGIFFARLICVKNNETFEIDSRTSDAVAMAVRFNCPIYTYEFILESAGISYEEEEAGAETPASAKKKKRKPKKSKSIDSLSLEELNAMLAEVLENEDYERAAKIRDEINKRMDRAQ